MTRKRRTIFAPLLSQGGRWGLEFWLPLPLIALGIWGGAGWLDGRVLSQPRTIPDDTIPIRQGETYLTMTLTVTSIDAEIDEQSGSTSVVVQTVGSSLQALEFEYPFVDFAEVERAIATDLDLPVTTIQTLVRYRLD
ncbi:hypothetical protein [Spirulina major]|uniref:hypothetical protein n=1 Tax=Spirulina major TaxID=270636 RepID=UPI000932A68E|nr:hypothetical protein [Spirulina major]